MTILQVIDGREREVAERAVYAGQGAVASSRERIERAGERWKNQQFPAVPDETDFIPLPT